MKALALLLGFTALAGCMSFNTVEVPIGPRHSDYAERVVDEDASPQGKIALIDVEGVLTSEHEESIFGSRESKVISFVEKLKIAEADPEVRAVVVRIDSPGGDVTTSDILYNELREFRRRKGVPVVAAFMGVSASGGYYLACAADAIVAHPTTLTGSIGVVALHVSLTGLMEKIGVKVEALKSGPHKDTGSPFRDLTEQDRAILQTLIDQSYERFVGVVAEGRRGRLTPPEARALADGRVFTARQALEAKLVDRVGYLQDAVKEAKSRAGLAQARLVMYSRKPRQLENPYSQSPSAQAFLSSDLDRVRGLLGFRLYYLWEPFILGK